MTVFYVSFSGKRCHHYRIHTIQPLRSRLRYWMASLRWVGEICSDFSISATACRVSTISLSSFISTIPWKWFGIITYSSNETLFRNSPVFIHSSFTINPNLFKIIFPPSQTKEPYPLCKLWQSINQDWNNPNILTEPILFGI